MILLRTGLLAFAVILGGLFSTSASDWQTYHNHEHGFSLEYPTGLFTNRAPSEYGEGVTFSSTDHSRRLSIYGFNNGDELSKRTIAGIIRDKSPV